MVDSQQRTKKKLGVAGYVYREARLEVSKRDISLVRKLTYLLI